jgi:hypothetical protein
MKWHFGNKQNRFQAGHPIVACLAHRIVNECALGSSLVGCSAVRSACRPPAALQRDPNPDRATTIGFPCR